MSRRDAREWVPSRFRLSAFKLIGYFAAKHLSRENPDIEPVTILSYREGQHPFEAFFLATSMLILSSAFAADAMIAAFDPPAWGTVVAITVSPLLAWIGWLVVLTALWPPIALARKLNLVKSRRNVELQTTLQQMVVLAICVVVVLHETWSSAAALIWIILVSTNLLSAIAVFALRAKIASLEKELAENPCAV